MNTENQPREPTHVIAPVVSDLKWVTPGKRYAVIEPGEIGFEIRDDSGDLINCLWKRCAFLHGGDWIPVYADEDTADEKAASPAVNPEPDGEPAVDFAPGTFGCHEALHMASVFADLIGRRLCEHTAIKLNPEWKRLADTAADALADLYQSIGAAHLSDDREGA